MADHRLAAGPHNSPGYWLYHASLSWVAAVTTRLREVGLTQPQFMVLASAGWLSRTGDQPTQQAIADHAGVDRMLASRLLRRLTDQGLLERQPDPADARAIRITVTARGREVTRRAVDAVRTVDDTVFGPDPATVRDLLMDIDTRCRHTRVAEDG